jgi:acetoin utilization protein AcuB
VEETAQVLQKNRISGAPVVDANGQLVGTITQTDLFRVLISLTGVGNGGIQFGFQVEDRPGSIKEVADVIRSFGGRMVSILTSYDDLPEGYRKMYIRMRRIERSELQKLIQELESKAGLLYMVDHTENNREIYAEKIALVIMGTHGRKGMDKIIFGSVAERVLKASPVPVMVVNPYKTGLE